MCALVGYIATGRTDLSASLVPAASVTLTLPPSTGNPESWTANNGRTGPSATFVASPSSTAISSIVPATSGDLGLTVFNPPGSLPVVDSPSPQPSPDSGSSSSSSPCPENNLEDSTQDIISRPTQDVLAISPDSDISVPAPSSSTTPTSRSKHNLHARSSDSQGKGKGRETVEDVLYELSLQLASSVSSVSQILDMDFIRALADSFNREVSEILALLDHFVREVKSHGTNFLEDPKRAMKRLKKKLTRGNKQARKNAKTIAEIGERFFEMVASNIEAVASVGHGTEQGEVKKTGKSTRGARAKERALKMHKKVFKSEEWLKHQREVAQRRAGAVQAQ